MTKYQKFVVAILAFLQFTIILDFMILSPLGAILMPALEINTSQFGLVVSAYAFSAGLAGFLAAGFADRFDRKKLLMFFYTGFIIGTLLCGVATNFQFLLFARIVTGLFGGVVGSVVFAITTDLFPLEMRGRVMGVVQTAFAVSQVLGLPFGLFLSNHWGWHSPFILIVAIGAAVGVVIMAKMQPIDKHLALKPDRKAFHHLLHTISQPRYLQGFATTALLATGGFLIMPFSSAFSVNNLKVSLEQLPLVYMVTGVCSMIAAPLLGRMTDKVGRFQVFLLGSIISIVLVLIYTNLGATPLLTVMIISAIMFVGISARMISSSAIVSAIPQPTDRGAYMSISSSIQQISGGIASAVGGMLIVQETSGHIEHFDRLGYLMTVTTIITTIMMYLIDRYVRLRGAAPVAVKA
jgi:predicted MFS family arabinose efflux permease